MNIRNTIDGIIYDMIEFYSSKCFENGENTEYIGVPLFKEDSKFVKGCFFDTVSKLYIHYFKTGDKRQKEVEQRLHFAVSILKNDISKTWGKLAMLRGLCLLQKENLISVLSSDELEILENVSRYDDFFDKENLKLKGYASNYYQVAMACAGMREKLGFENNGMCEKIKDKFLSSLDTFSENGWMDDNPPFGRYDRYSTIISAEISDTLFSLGIECPDFAKDNLKSACDLALACANNAGDGVIYGRSLSIHGDCAFIEIISTALRMGLIPENKIDLALRYSHAILKKVMKFWYDGDRNSFNIWFDGRTTNNYRQVHRLLEVDLDMCNHFYNTLLNFDAAGYADYETDGVVPVSEYKFGNPYKVIFEEKENKIRCLYVFIQNGKLIQLPFISAGTMGNVSAYMPFPASVGNLEASPELKSPWLVPEFRTPSSEYTYIPTTFFTSVTDENSENKTVINVKGHLAAYKNKEISETEYNFKSIYTFENDSVTMDFECDLPSCIYKVIYPRPYGTSCMVTANGKSNVSEIFGNKDYFTPHGSCTVLKTWEGNGNKVTISAKGIC